MKEKRYYLAPQAYWSELEQGELVCDSYDSGVDDFDYEEIDWKS